MRDDTCCEYCLAHTGPLLERARPYDGHEGRELDPSLWAPFVRAVAFEDGWMALWEALGHEPLLACPFHAEEKTVPRRPQTTSIGGFLINLQEFDYVGHRRETVIFRHVETHRYLNILPIGPTAVAIERVAGEVFHRPVVEAIRWARIRD